MKFFKEEMTTGPMVPGTGDTGEAFKPSRPIARRGKFAGYETFVLAHETFNSLRLAKKYNPGWYQWRLSNYWERAVLFKVDQVPDREQTRYK